MELSSTISDKRGTPSHQAMGGVGGRNTANNGFTFRREGKNIHQDEGRTAVELLRQQKRLVRYV